MWHPIACPREYCYSCFVLLLETSNLSFSKNVFQAWLHQQMSDHKTKEKSIQCQAFASLIVSSKQYRVANAICVYKCFRLLQLTKPSCTNAMEKHATLWSSECVTVHLYSGKTISEQSEIWPWESGIRLLLRPFTTTCSNRRPVIILAGALFLWPRNTLDKIIHDLLTIPTPIPSCLHQEPRTKSWRRGFHKRLFSF